MLVALIFIKINHVLKTDRQTDPPTERRTTQRPHQPTHRLTNQPTRYRSSLPSLKNASRSPFFCSLLKEKSSHVQIKLDYFDISGVLSENSNVCHSSNFSALSLCALLYQTAGTTSKAISTERFSENQGGPGPFRRKIYGFWAWQC